MDATRRVVEILDGLPSFLPCRGPVDSWPEDVQIRYCPVWFLWSQDLRCNPPPIKQTWWAYGNGRLLKVPPNGFPVFSTVGGSATPAMQPAIERVLAAKATSVPEYVGVTIENAWRQSWGTAPEVIIRNEWHERRELLKPIRSELAKLLPLAIRAVARARGEVAHVQQLDSDDVLHVETVDAAIGELRRALPAPSVPDQAPAPAPGMPYLMTGREAAAFIGISESTLSRWQQNVPAWARANELLFRHLLSRDEGRYPRTSVRKLKQWFEAAENAGDQKPVECP